MEQLILGHLRVRAVYLAVTVDGHLPNKERDQQSDSGMFMSDAATAYAVLSLTYRK